MTTGGEVDAAGARLHSEIARLRVALRQDAAAADHLRVLANMVTALTELCRRSPQRTAEVRGDLDDVYTQVKRLLAEQPLAAGDETFAACVLADVCVLRGGDSDIAEAVDSIRTVRALLPDEHPGQANLEIELGGALCELAARPGGGLAELDEAAAAFTAARLLLPRDDTRQPAIAARLAMMRALRFGTYGGAPEDRDEAIALAGECLAWRGRDQTVADSCHLVIAWMMLTRQFTSAQRSATRIVPDLGRGPRRGPGWTASPTWMPHWRAWTRPRFLSPTRNRRSRTCAISRTGPSLTTNCQGPCPRCGRWRRWS